MATYKKNTYIRDTYDLFESVARPNRSFNALQIYNALNALDLAPGGRTPEGTIQNYMQRFVTENPGVIRRHKVDGVFHYKKMFKDDTVLIKYQKNKIQTQDNKIKVQKRNLRFYKDQSKERGIIINKLYNEIEEKDNKIQEKDNEIEGLKYQLSVMAELAKQNTGIQNFVFLKK